MNTILTRLYHKHPARVTATISMLIFVCSTLPLVLLNGGFYLDGDYCKQYIPFHIETRRMLESGSLWWSWNSGFGCNFIGSYSYYTLFNPFSLLIILAPIHLIPHTMYIVQILKFAIGAYIAFHYLRMFVNNRLATLGSLLYIYASYITSIFWFYNFMDATILYPLILISIERYIKEGKKDYGHIALAFFINAISHYYLFVGTIIGTLIYGLVRIFSEDWKNNIRSRFFYVVLSAVLGTTMAAFVFLPAGYAITGGARGSQPIGTGVTTIITRLTSLFFPIDGRGCNAVIPWAGSFPPSCCLPIVSATIAIAYVIKNPRSWLSCILVIFTLCLATPYCAGIFNLYTEPAYSRWLYQMIMMLALATVLYIQEYGSRTKLLKQLAWVVTTIIIATIAATTLIMFLYKNEYLPDQLQLWCERIIKDYPYPFTTSVGLSAISLALLNQALLLLYLYNKSIKMRYLLLFIGISGGLQYTAYLYNHQTRGYDFYNGNISHTFTHRYAFDDYKVENTGQYYSKPSPNHYHSILDKNLAPLHQLKQMGFSSINYKTDALYALSSVKTVITDDNTSNYPGEIIGEQPFPYYIPMGFTYDSYLPQSEVIKWSQTVDTIPLYHLMLATIIIPDSNITQLPSSMTQYSIPDTLPHISTLTEQRRKACCSSFVGTSDGFTAQIELEQPEIVFFSIPCNEGFTVKVNGVEQQPIKVNIAFMGILCNEGINHITAQYRTPLLHEGVIISVLALLLMCSAVYINNRLQSKTR